MPKIKIKAIDNEAPFINDIQRDGYHVGTLIIHRFTYTLIRSVLVPAYKIPQPLAGQYV